MSRIKSKGMAPELTVRRLVYSLGYRYRLHLKNLPGKPDLVFIGRRKVIFVHGCFWHQHKDPACKIQRIPKSRQEYWIPKLQRNVVRDKSSVHALKKDGWQVMVIWECDLKELDKLPRELVKFLG